MDGRKNFDSEFTIASYNIRYPKGLLYLRLPTQILRAEHLITFDPNHKDLVLDGEHIPLQ